jgi:hypothetical protein
MSTPISLFVSQLSSLGSELNDMYPEDTDIKMAKNTIETLKILNPKKLYEIFSNFVVPYRDQIINRDDTFFLSMDYSNVLNSDVGDGYNITTVMNLKKYWSGMSDTTKECMWQYFGVLVMLCDKIGK